MNNIFIKSAEKVDRLMSFRDLLGGQKVFNRGVTKRYDDCFNLSPDTFQGRGIDYKGRMLAIQ